MENLFLSRSPILSDTAHVTKTIYEILHSEKKARLRLVRYLGTPEGRFDPLHSEAEAETKFLSEYLPLH